MILPAITNAVAFQSAGAEKFCNISRFGSEDLRAMALSLFIQHARDGSMR